ncbi:MAG: DUF1127 domain-containing protein [Limimaricola soesokkakensis]|uniref:Uncharacterized protein DUF1127 n=1 Tax=Limimaricola soesokkakensis TaxID=1343159 RepID=A0A1X7A0D4_9RHOB|nr:DUF1127 domain-containing protein [Limimaricola soesokkakensis]PSK82571.1 uncharacterized protein DUF1127 [Limimaricola soesokkakensis]SLN66376.1 hypothetical protein LOS8367_03285 [Limimaricola soesokkakensis]
MRLAVPSQARTDVAGYLASATTRWRVYRRTVSELSRLSDRDLADLGFARSQIREIARDAATRAVAR